MVLEELSFKKILFFLNLMLPWQPNKMATGHQTHKLGRQSSYDIITAKYGSHHFTGYGANANKSFSNYKSMGAFCCYGNQTKKHITIILAIFNSPYPNNI